MKELQELFPWLDTELSGIPAWQWIAMPLLFASAYLGARFLVGLFLLLAGQIATGNGWVRKYVVGASHPFALLLAAILFKGAQKALPFAKETVATLSYFNTTVYAFALVWLLIIYINNGSDSLQERLIRERRYSAAAIIPLMRKIIKISAILIAFLFLLQNWGFDVAALITALGVGGVAIALASQKSMENLFGGIMISLDQPIRVGDFGKFGDVFGTVEDIGLRSTRIRTLERTLLTIPNAEMASMRLENFAVRDKMLLKKNIGLRYETTPDQMRYIITKMKEMLVSHPLVENDPARARFINYGSYSLDIEIFAYIKAQDMNKFTEVQEDILLRIKEIVQEAGSDFAFPSQTLYMARGSGMDEDKQKEIGRHVYEARAKGQLQWPNLDPELEKDLTDSIPYPPKGSVVAS